jgi:imidazolonepropionase-like amidohydrolase
VVVVLPREPLLRGAIVKRLLIAGSLLLVACTRAPTADLAIRDVTVVDVTDGALHASQTVLVRGNRILAVGPSDELEVPDDAAIVEGAGGYLIPGLWDTHVHSASSADWHFPLFVAYGITSVRNMHSTVDNPLELVRSIQRELAAGTLLGPRFLANGGVVDGDPAVWPGSAVVRNANEARRAVDSLANGGADFIKVYDNLSPESYLALVERAKQLGIPVDGHLPWLVRPEDGAAAGQRTFEHTTGISMGCSSEADAVRAGYGRYLEDLPNASYPEAMGALVELLRRIMATRDPALCEETARTIREHGVAAVPTLVITMPPSARAFIDDSTRMRLLPQSIREQWQGMAAAGPGPFDGLSDLARETAPANVRLLNDSGVVILAGTDVGNPFLAPGASLHRELVLLNEAGLSRLQALQSATIAPSRVFGLADSSGTIETGKLADLVLLDANPLEDIRNTQRIRAVVVNGRYLDRASLDGLLESAVRWSPPATAASPPEGS